MQRVAHCSPLTHYLHKHGDICITFQGLSTSILGLLSQNIMSLVLRIFCLKLLNMGPYHARMHMIQKKCIASVTR